MYVISLYNQSYNAFVCITTNTLEISFFASDFTRTESGIFHLYFNPMGLQLYIQSIIYQALNRAYGCTLRRYQYSVVNGVYKALLLCVGSEGMHFPTSSFPFLLC